MRVSTQQQKLFMFQASLLLFVRVLGSTGDTDTASK